MESVAVVKVHAVLLTIASPSLVVPSKTSTRVPASVVPESTSTVSLVVPLLATGPVMSGASSMTAVKGAATGAIVSTVIAAGFVRAPLRESPTSCRTWIVPAG